MHLSAEPQSDDMHSATQGSSEAAQGVQRYHNSSAKYGRGGRLLALGTGVTAGTSRTSDSCFLFCTLQAVLWETESRRIHNTREQERGGRAGRHTGGGVEEYPPSACHWLRHRPYHKPRGENPRPIRDGDSYDVIRRGSRMFRVVWR